MENNRLFKFLWRANAVFLFIAGVGLIALLIMMFSFVMTDLRPSASPPPAVTASVQPEGETDVFSLRHPSHYEKNFGTDFTYFELRSGTDNYGKLSASTSSQLRNMGVYNLKTDEIHWVFPNARQEIEAFKSVGKTIAADTQDEKRVRTGFLVTVSKTLEDTSIARELFSMSPDGKDLKKILSDVAEAPAIKTYGDGQTKLIIETKTHIDVYPFDVDTLTVGEPIRVSMP